eukprot:m.55183 g.55183  ORF g.55183 m.55183 type:complete len:56 (+) comp22030_c1_seq1:2070-2237(+)
MQVVNTHHLNVQHVILFSHILITPIFSVQEKGCNTCTAKSGGIYSGCAQDATIDG